jgi:hypothetical protein
VTVAAHIRGQCRLTLALLFMISGALDHVAAQSLSPGPPGPFVFDARGAMSGVPTSVAFVPPDSTTATIPGRGFGGTMGAHVYAIRIGAGRLGFGADLMYVRGTTVDVTTTFSAVDPQVSFNFGTSDGWSYLSGGVGSARVSVEPAGLSESVRAFNWGGGARWFLSPHVGIGFDIRVRHLAAGTVVPKGVTVASAVGFSLK